MLNVVIFFLKHIVALMTLHGIYAQIKKHDCILNLCLIHCALIFFGVLQYFKLGSCMKQSAIKL